MAQLQTRSSLVCMYTHENYVRGVPHKACQTSGFYWISRCAKNGVLTYYRLLALTQLRAIYCKYEAASDNFTVLRSFIECGPGSSVGIATDYGLDGPGSNPGGDEFFRPSRPALRPTQPPVQWVPGLSRGRGGRGVRLTPQHPSRVPRS